MSFDSAYNEPESTEVLVCPVDPDAPVALRYAHAGDAGADLMTTEHIELKPFERAVVHTGVRIALPAGYVALVHPRSGLAVKQGVTVLNAPGTIDAGYRGEIKVPLTLAILPTLMVKVGSQSFALPLTSVNEIFHLRLDGVKKVDGQDTIVIREKAIPLFYLQDWLIRNHSQGFMHPEWGHVVLVQQGNGNQVAFVVDELVGQEEVVIKPLDQLLHGTPGMAGATITSDGGIALILDIPSLLRGYAKKDISKSAVRRPARREAAATASPPVV